MSSADFSSPSSHKLAGLKKVSKNTWIIGGALTVYAGISTAILIDAGAVPHFRIDLSPVLTAGTAIQVHVTAAVTTLAIGTFLMFAPKGFRLHRTFGWAWVIAMALTAGSTFFIQAIFQNAYSPIHALSAWTLLGLPFGIAAVKRRDVKKHRKMMTDMFVGGMLIAGLFSLLPGRMMWHVFFAV